MRIPNSFKQAVAKAFYDKDMTLYNILTNTDAVGQEVQTVGSEISTFKGSVKFNDLKTIQEEYGIEVEIHIAISVDPDTAVSLNDLVKYRSTYYEVIQAIPFDSSLIILGKIWQ